MEQSHRSCLPSTRCFQSSPTQPSRRRDDFSCSPRHAQVSTLLSHHPHDQQSRDDLVMIMAPLIEFCFRRLHRPAILLGDMPNEQWAAIALVPISLAASFFLCLVMS